LATPNCRKPNQTNSTPQSQKPSSIPNCHRTLPGRQTAHGQTMWPPRSHSSIVTRPALRPEACEEHPHYDLPTFCQHFRVALFISMGSTSHNKRHTKQNLVKTLTGFPVALLHFVLTQTDIPHSVSKPATLHETPTHRLSKPGIIMTALHVERLYLCRKSAQQDWLINGVCHQSLRSFRNILRLRKTLLKFKTKTSPIPWVPHVSHPKQFQTCTRIHTFILMYLNF